MTEFYIAKCDLSIIKGKVVDHTIDEVRETSLLYNKLKAHGYNICISKMRPMHSLIKTPNNPIYVS